MPQVAFTCSYTENHVGLIVDLECEVDCIVEPNGAAEPEVTVVDVDAVEYRYDAKRRCLVIDKRTNLLTSDSAVIQALGREIISAAQNDQALIAKAIEVEGIYWAGSGSNDPDGHYRSAA